MARYKHIDMSPRLLPVVLEDQLVPGSFAHAVHVLVDQLDLSGFDAHYRNDKLGCAAFAPSILLKAVLLAYSQGIVSLSEKLIFYSLNDQNQPQCGQSV
jgi:transposase